MDKKTILVVEDDLSLQRVYLDHLSKQGYNVLTASDGTVGLQLALEKRPDLMILDLLMPNGSGQSVLESLRNDSWGNGLPVIVATNSTDTLDINQTVRLHPQNYFVKSETSLVTLDTAVKNLLEA